MIETKNLEYSVFLKRNLPPAGTASPEEIAKRIRSNSELETYIAQLRQAVLENNRKKADEIKSSLPAVSFSATFLKRRRYDNLIHYTGEITLDFDKLKPEELQHIRQVAEREPHTHFGFLSPSGNGYKLTVLTAPAEGNIPQSPEEVRNYHAHAYDQVCRLYRQLIPCNPDTSGKDMTRICYLSHDPNLHYNPQAVPLIIDLTQPLLSKEEKKASPNTRLHREADSGYTPLERRAILEILLNQYNQKADYRSGNRNNYLFQLSCIFNRYGIPEAEAYTYICDNFTDLPKSEISSLVQSAYRNHQEEHNSYKLNNKQWNFLQMKLFIQQHYETRYNIVKHRIECRKHGEKKFLEADDRLINTIWVELNENGHCYNVHQVESLIHSDFSTIYHPIRDYLENLPAWDGIDHLQKLLDSVTTEQTQFWEKAFKHFMVGMVASAMDDEIVNHLCLLLCSGQNIGKTTFINRLLPPELHEYLCTGSIGSGNKDELSRLAEFWLINLDEYESMNTREMNLLKDLITRTHISIRLPYGRRTQTLPHLASFAGTCNYPHILNDPTGTRRFLCFQVQKITRYPINYPQLYAQLLHLYNNKYKYWFDADEVSEIEKNNTPFIYLTPEEEQLLTHFRKPEPKEMPKYMTVSEIAEVIRSRTGYVYNHYSKILLGKALHKHGFKYIEGHNGKRYEVILYSMDEVKNRQAEK